MSQLLSNDLIKNYYSDKENIYNLLRDDQIDFESEHSDAESTTSAEESELSDNNLSLDSNINARAKNILHQSPFQFNEFPLLKQFRAPLGQILRIPKDYKFNDLSQYTETMVRLSKENYFRKFRDSLKKNILSNENNGKEENAQDTIQATRKEYCQYTDYTVINTSFEDKGLVVKVLIKTKIAKYQRDDCKIKDNQLILFVHKETKKIFIGKTIKSDLNSSEEEEENEVHAKRDLNEENEISNKYQKQSKNDRDQFNDEDFEDGDDDEIDDESDFKIISIEQVTKIKMNVDNNIDQFLQDLTKIESRYDIIQPHEYWCPLQFNLECISEFRKKNDIAFPDQTLNGDKGDTKYPSYEFLCDHKDIENYKELIEFQISKEDKLDKYQFTALKHALSNQNALIQGPPGTGKTFLASKIVKILTNVYQKQASKPILVISKKNESLDQLLLKILDQDSNISMLRLGTRTSCEEINELTVRNQHGPFKKYYTPENITDINENLQSHIKKLKKLDSYKIFANDEELALSQMIQKKILQKFNKLLKKDISIPNECKIDSGIKDALFQKWVNGKLSFKNVRRFLKQSDITLNDEKIATIQEIIEKQNNIQTCEIFKTEETLLSHIASLKSFSEFTKGFREALKESSSSLGLSYLISSMKDYERDLTIMQKECMIDYSCKLNDFMGQYDVIGMTVSGYHMNYRAISKLKPEIVLVEEASEIIESEFFPILAPWLKHLIQIGDHLQLRPVIKSNQLQNVYNYKSSYFERLITVNKIQLVTLLEQRRMMPEFANFTRLFYGKGYSDSACTYQRKYVKQLSTNGMFMLQHTFPEQLMPDCSYTNLFEATYIVNLVKLLSKKYDCKRITVISMYKSQKVLIKSKLSRRKIFKEVEVCTVDQFQGNENDIIILSCVRSNNEDKLGFVANDHRINVAYSRARQGFFCIGNFVMMGQQSETWKKINALCLDQMSFGGQYISNQYQKLFDQTTNQMCNQCFNNEQKYNDINYCNKCDQECHIGYCLAQIDETTLFDYIKIKNVSKTKLKKSIQSTPGESVQSQQIQQPIKQENPKLVTKQIKEAQKQQKSELITNNKIFTNPKEEYPSFILNNPIKEEQDKHNEENINEWFEIGLKNKILKTYKQEIGQSIQINQVMSQKQRKQLLKQQASTNKKH